MNGPVNESKWVWTGDDQGLIKILKEIDKHIVKSETDSKSMEASMTKAMKGSARSVDYLRDRLKSFQQMRDLAFDERKIAKFNMEIKKTQHEIRRLEQLGTNKKGGGGMFMGMPTRGFGSELGGFLSSPQVQAGFLVASAARQVANFAIDSTSYGRNMSTQMAKINATAQMTPERLAALRDSFFPIANNLKVDVNSLPGAYEALISATGDKAAADRLLTPALKLAKGGFTDPSITGRALSQIKMTPGVNMTEMQIADMLMAAKNYGRGELSDFANYLPGLISTGKLRGFSEQDVVGSYSYLSRSNSAEQSATLMSNFMNVVLRKDVTDKIREKIKVDVFDKAGGLRDMSDIITDISKAMNGLSDKGKQSFLDSIKVVDQQAFQAMGALTANAKELDKAINAVQNSTGTLDRTIAVSQDANAELIKFNNNISQFKSSIASITLPIANGVLGFANDKISSFNYQMADFFMSDEEKSRNRADKSRARVQRNIAYGTNIAQGVLSKYSNLGIDDRVAASMDEIREMIYGAGYKTSSAANDKIKSYLYKLAKVESGNKAVDNITSENSGSASPDAVMKEHRQVRNVTVNIDQLLKLENVSVGTGSDLVNLTSEDVLNAFIKVVRDAEQSLETR